MKRRWTELSREGYADLVPPALSDIEVARLWRGLAAPTAPPARRRFQRPPILLALGAALLAAGVAFVLVLLFSPEPAPTSLRDTFPARIDDRAALELPDGCRLLHMPGAEVKLMRLSPDEAELLLVQGAIEIQLPAAARRRLVVSAAGFDLLPREGRFRAALLGDFPDRRLEVTVLDGRLDVAPPALTLTAGQSWSSHPVPSEPY